MTSTRHSGQCANAYKNVGDLKNYCIQNRKQIIRLKLVIK